MELHEVEIYVRNVVRESQNVIRQSEDGVQIKEALLRVKQLMLETSPCADARINAIAVKDEFQKVHYQKWLTFLLGNCKKEWLDLADNPMHVIDAFFLEGGVKQHAFITLCHAVNTSGSGFMFNKIVTILEKFVSEGHMHELMKDCCEIEQSSNGVHSHQQEELVNFIASLPEKVTAKLKRETSEMFYPGVYMKRMALAISAALRHTHSRVVGNKCVNYACLGQILGKLCITGHGDLIWPILLDELEPLVYEDILWCQVCENVVQEIPERALESVIVALVQNALWYGTLARILGENIMQHKVKFLLTNKLILLRHFKEVRVLQNIIGCLASSPSRSYLVAQVLESVLEVWSDGSAVRHTSYEQHLYVTKSILVSLSMLSPKDKQKLKSKLLTSMMPGIQVHLDSSLPQVRRLGMVVAESVSSVIDPDGPALKFEYEKDEETEELVSLLQPLTPPEINTQRKKRANLLGIPKKVGETVRDECGPSPSRTSKDDQENDSSDDDLQPYDMSNDVKVQKVKRPLYLRDCMTGLLSGEDPEKIEVSLQAAESLIRSHPSSVIEVSVEFAKILLHLQDTGVIDRFAILRHKAVVALLVTSPKQVATYLTEEFYGPNYNIGQRLDILEGLVDAAQELSSVRNTTDLKAKTEVQGRTERDSIPQCGEDKDWRKIVEERIAKKTRRFAHGHKLPPPASLSRFAPVAGYFFFPLLAKYDQPERTLDLLGNDHMVLQRLLFSLGVIIHSAVNAPIASQMGAALLKFVWMLRYHPQPAVRRGILFSICMFLLSVPGHVLLMDMNEDLVELKLWLQDVAESDADEENKKLSLHGLVLMQEVVKKELEKS